MQKIKIGTIIEATNIKMISKLIPYGFETFAITFGNTTAGHNLKTLSDEVKEMLDGTECKISCISVFGNALMDTNAGLDTRNGFYQLIDAAKLFGTDLVTGFAGRVTDKSVEESIPKFKEVFTDICKKAEEKNVRIAIENCSMGGNWGSGDLNIGFSPKAWELMFDAVPYDNFGLQWEPAHQMAQLIDPIPQLRKWVPKIFNLHGKDSTIAWDVVKERGIYSGENYVWDRTPGFGDSNWTNIISILRMNGFEGSIDIEGFHDPVYRDELEYTGQIHALNYLKNCRGGDIISL